MGSRLRLSMSSRECDIMKGSSSQKFMLIFMYLWLHLFQITSQTLEKYYHYRKIKIKMGCLYSNWTPTFWPRGGGALPLDSKVISMLVVFLGYKILILIFFRVLRKILCRNEIMVFLGSAHFPYRARMKSFQNVFSKLEKIVCQTVIRLFN